MRDSSRIDEILRAVEEIWRRSPDLRLGQILVNAIRPANSVPEVYYAEDDQVLRGLRDYAQAQARGAFSESDDGTV